MAARKDPERFAGKIGIPGSPLPLAWWLPPHGVVRTIGREEMPVGPARAGSPAVHPPPPRKRGTKR